MQYRTLGKDLTISAVGLGCMGMSHAYGAPADKKEMTELLARAVDMGCTFFDTAELYGTPENPHDNEELLGPALKPYRDKIVLATKFGITFDWNDPDVNKPVIPDSRPESIRKAVEGSLKRLQTDHIDLYYQHRQDPSVPVEEVAGIMSRLIEEGKITHWGLSEVTEDTIRRAHKICPVTAIQNRYSMMFRNYEALFGVLEELNIGLVAFSPLANGFLTARYTAESKFDPQEDYRSAMPQFKKEAFAQNGNLLALLEETAKAKNAAPEQISLAWMLNKKPYIVPIPGTRKLNRLAENLGAADIVLTAGEVASIAESLRKLKTGYIDLLLIHQPFSDYYGTWRAMEEAYKNGQLRAIGVANFYPDRLIDLCQFAEIAPMVNQVETHVFWQQQTAHAIMQKYGITHQSWGPFAEGRNGFFTNGVLNEVAAKYNKSAAQVALRFLIQCGVVVIPKSVHKDRMVQNFDIFDFKLSDDDMAKIRALDTGRSLFFSHYDPATVEFLTNMGKHV